MPRLRVLVVDKELKRLLDPLLDNPGIELIHFDSAIEATDYVKLNPVDYLIYSDRALNNLAWDILKKAVDNSSDGQAVIRQIDLLDETQIKALLAELKACKKSP